MSINAPHLEEKVFLIHLVHITWKDFDGNLVIDLRIQNNYNPSYIWRSQTWQYLPFEVSEVSYSTEIDNLDANLTFPNVSLIRDPIKQYDGLRKGICKIYTIFPDVNPDIARQDILQIAYPEFNYTTINFVLKTPINAIEGFIPTRVFEGNLFRKLPFKQSVNI